MPTADNARAFLAQVAARYASISSYSDSGSVHTVLVDNERGFTTTFSTRYKKPSLYRFEYQRLPAHPSPLNVITKNIVIFDGTAVHICKETGSGGPQSYLAESFSLAIAAATVPSSGSAHRIGRLLIPAIGGLSTLDLVDLSQSVETAFDGDTCYSLAGRYPKSITPDIELFIEKNTLLVRGVKTVASEFSVTELRHSIRINEPIDDALFRHAA